MTVIRGNVEALRPLFEDSEELLPRVLSFLDQTSLSRVSRAFQKANRFSMQETGDQIFESRIFNAEVLDVYNRETEDSVGGAIDRLAPTLTEDLEDDALIVCIEKVAEQRSMRSFACLEWINKKLATMEPEEIIVSVKAFLVQESLLSRFKASTSMRVLVESQKRSIERFHREVVRYKAEVERPFKGSFQVERFQKAEELIIGKQISNELVKDRNFDRLWDALGAAGGILPAQNPPADDTPTSVRREWLRANIALLASVSHLTLVGVSDAPPELELLNGLRILNCQGVDELPLTDFSAHLPALNWLTLEKSRFDLLPELALLKLADARLIIFKSDKSSNLSISKAVAEMHCTGVASHLFEAAWGMGLGWLDQGIMNEDGISYFLGLKREALVEIPFFLWFRDTFSLPYIPIITLAVMLAGGAAWFIADCFCLAEILIYPIALVGVLAAVAGNLAFHLPIFAFNLLLNWGVQPIVSHFRERLGYSPMVKLRDPVPVGAA
ncbi:MAG: hypothetical protein HYX48_03665 [Chlamydiales bacterium]|nr:hypothetical protein [Chlamydiales bacterium]